MTDTLAWGILATGKIARAFAKALTRSRTGKLVAVGSRAQASADQFGDEFNIARRYGSYEALLDDKDVQAVYVSTPHPMHAEWAIRAADAGKHVLCEKPLALNHAEAVTIIEAARRNGIFLMEAFMYRCHPQTARLVELIRQKTIGEVRMIQAAFSFGGDFPLESRALNQALGGGGILDVGCYCVSMTRLIAGIATGRDFAEPLEVKGAAYLGSASRVDEWAVASLKFPGEILASLATGVQAWAENAVGIFGSEGHILVPVPWAPAREGGTTRILVHRHGQKEPQETLVHADRPLFAIEADTVATNLAKQEAPPPAMTWDDTLGNMKTLDRWRESVGLVYDAERALAPQPPPFSS